MPSSAASGAIHLLVASGSASTRPHELARSVLPSHEPSAQQPSGSENQSRAAPNVSQSSHTTASGGGSKECVSPVRTAESTYPAAQSSAEIVPATTGTPFECKMENVECKMPVSMLPVPNWALVLDVGNISTLATFAFPSNPPPTIWTLFVPPFPVPCSPFPDPPPCGFIAHSTNRPQNTNPRTTLPHFGWFRNVLRTP